LAPGIFDVLAYTDAETAVPFTWVESDAKLIDNPQMVKLHSFDTKVTPRSFVLGMCCCAV
jgi:mitotic spindle assembly checkpoint protein MAD2